MILGRPTNLWLGFSTALTGFVGLVSASMHNPIDPIVLSGLTVLLGAFIALIANSPATVNAGDTVNVHRPEGQDNTTFTVK